MKVALQTGASLVPVYTFGENDVVTVVDTRKVPLFVSLVDRQQSHNPLLS